MEPLEDIIKSDLDSERYQGYDYYLVSQMIILEASGIRYKERHHINPSSGESIHLNP